MDLDKFLRGYKKLPFKPIVVKAGHVKQLDYYLETIGIKHERGIPFMAILDRNNEVVLNDNHAASTLQDRLNRLMVRKNMSPAERLYETARSLEQQTVPDIPGAVEHYKKSAGLGHIPPMYELTTIYAKGRRGFPQNHEQAWNWAQKCAKAGNPDCWNYVAHMLRKGLGVRRDPEASFKIYKYLDENPSDTAISYSPGDLDYNLGVAYAGGDGVAADYERAYFRFSCAAKNNDTDQQVRSDAMQTARTLSRHLSQPKRQEIDMHLATAPDTPFRNFSRAENAPADTVAPPLTVPAAASFTPFLTLFAFLTLVLGAYVLSIYFYRKQREAMFRAAAEQAARIRARKPALAKTANPAILGKTGFKTSPVHPASQEARALYVRSAPDIAGTARHAG